MREVKMVSTGSYLPGEPIDVRGADILAAVTAQVGPAHVIDQDNDDVGTAPLRGRL